MSSGLTAITHALNITENPLTVSPPPTPKPIAPQMEEEPVESKKVEPQPENIIPTPEQVPEPAAQMPEPEAEGEKKKKQFYKPKKRKTLLSEEDQGMATVGKKTLLGS